MTVLDVLKKAILILQDDELYKGITENDEKFESEKELLLTAYNQAVTSVSTYFPCSFTENFQPINGVVSYERFTYNPYKIKSYKAENNSLSVKILPTEIRCEGDIEVTYYYFATANNVNENYPFEGVVSVDNVVYGVLAEYLLFKGRYEESSTYFDLFLKALKNLSYRAKKPKIQAREWY